MDINRMIFSKQKEFADLVTETKAAFDPAINFVQSDVLKSYLDQDAFIFSGLKAHRQLTQARSLLKDESGNIRPYQQFEQEIIKLNNTYNKLYLEAEYEFAVQSAQSADQWSNLSDDTDRYWLQYRTAQDERVREDHAALHGTTLPKDDPFWDSYYPPNGWRCRCVAVEVLARKNTLSDSKEAIKKGEASTTQIGKNGKNKLAMFRFNPGKQQKLFPPGHPYAKVPENVKSAIDKNKPNALIPDEITTDEQLNSVFKNYAKSYPDTFARGFNKIQVESKKSNNGSTDMNGTIYLTKPRIDHVKAGLNNVKKGLPTSFEQEDALSTMWHEINHNKNKIGNIPLDNGKNDGIQRRAMELANELVSRRTLPKFMEQLGGKLQNTDLISNRKSTGYNSMVNNYQSAANKLGCDIEKVTKEVSEQLFKHDYRSQKEGLTNALINNSEIKLGKNKAKSVVQNAINSWNEEKFNIWFDEFLENEKSLIKK